jgi:prolyl-tRNA editing enzyme YbaK/EbsC (Cys-tRNA(Pro) deacylase)
MADYPRRAGSRKRVRAFLEAHGLAEGLFEFDQSTHTAEQAADAMSCELGQIVKSLVFLVGDQPVMALVPGDKRGDSQAIAEHFGGDEVRIADAGMVRFTTGYSIGGVAPFDLPKEVPVVADASLSRYEIVYPGAGTPASMVRMRFADLLKHTGAAVADIAQ